MIALQSIAIVWLGGGSIAMLIACIITSRWFRRLRADWNEKGCAEFQRGMRDAQDGTEALILSVRRFNRAMRKAWRNRRHKPEWFRKDGRL